MHGRGGSWVIAQFALLLVIFLALLVPPRWPEEERSTLSVVGATLAIAGALVVIGAARALGRGLTPFPEPPPDAQVVEGGPFRVVRHPTYAGGLLFLVGWSLYAGPVALALTAGIGILWIGKIRSEERRLRARLPAYAGYAERVRYRLLPGVY